MSILKSYELAREQYAQIGVDTDKAIERLKSIPISIHCWQGDDVAGFESLDGSLDGGLAVTGNYPGKAKTPEQLRADMSFAFSLIPGPKKANIHAFYSEPKSRKVDRDAITPECFDNWADWAVDQKIGLDFNPTCFSHPKSSDGLTLSHPDEGIRNFWIEHCIRSREISEYLGKRTGVRTGNTLGKLANGITDTAVTMAAKAHLRNGRPLVIAVSTNDALGASAQNIGRLMNAKNVYFVPMGQDSPEGKPASMVAHFEKSAEAIESALSGKQFQPFFC